MKVYFVRHGMSEDHEQNRSQSHDSELSLEGIRQAERVAERLNGLKFDRILTSEWPRARRTGEIIAEKSGIKIEALEGIHERQKDTALEGVGYKDEIFEKFWEEFKKHGHEMDWKYGQGGESLQELVERAQKFKLHLIEHHINEDILVISHGLFIRAFVISTLLGDNFDEKSFVKLFNNISTSNVGLTLMDYFPDREHWELVFLNDHWHLQQGEK